MNASELRTLRRIHLILALVKVAADCDEDSAIELLNYTVNKEAVRERAQELLAIINKYEQTIQH